MNRGLLDERPIEALRLSVRTSAILRLAELRQVWQVAALSRAELRRIPNVTAAVMAELEFHGLVARSVVGGGDGVRLARVRGPLDHEDPLSAIYRALDYFPTPPWAARAGAELIQRIDPGTWRACEPACGEGHMAHGLGDYFAEVEAFDVYPHGYGGLADFLLDPIGQGADWIVTNPPFGLTVDFVRLALQRARRGVAILQRTTFFETIGRYPLFYGGQPMAVFSPFAERVPMTLGYWDPEASGQTPYAWYVWLKREVAEASPVPMIRAGAAFGTPIAPGIPPGTKLRLTAANDAELFGVAA